MIARKISYKILQNFERIKQANRAITAGIAGARVGTAPDRQSDYVRVLRVAYSAVRSRFTGALLHASTTLVRITGGENDDIAFTMTEVYWSVKLFVCKRIESEKPRVNFEKSPFCGFLRRRQFNKRCYLVNILYVS